MSERTIDPRDASASKNTPAMLLPAPSVPSWYEPFEPDLGLLGDRGRRKEVGSDLYSAVARIRPARLSQGQKTVSNNVGGTNCASVYSLNLPASNWPKLNSLGYLVFDWQPYLDGWIMSSGCPIVNLKARAGDTQPRTI